MMKPRVRVESDEVLFLALLGLMATVLGYRFGFGNQIEQLPLVMRALDASYLTNDFYVESASGFGPRFYYVHLVAGLARVAPLPVVFFGLTLVVNLALVGSTGGAHAPVACLCVLAARVRLLIPLAVAIVTFGLVVGLGSLGDSVLVALAAVVVLLWVRMPSGTWRHAMPVLLAVIVVLGAGYGRTNERFAATGLAPVLSLDDVRGDESDAARWVREHLDADAVFLAPPDFGAFRLLARRALVVDWKAIPFETLAMREWRERIRFCYGEVAAGGFAARDELQRGYLGITDAKLDAIRDRYGASFAILHAETPTRRSSIFANATYQIVAL
jgi:hypothetical protein